MLGFNRIVYNSTGGSSISIGAVTTAERNCSQRRFFQPLNFDFEGFAQYLAYLLKERGLMNWIIFFSNEMDFLNFSLQEYFKAIGWDEKKYYKNLLIVSSSVLDFNLPQRVTLQLGKEISPMLKSALLIGLPHERSLGYLFTSIPVNLPTRSLTESKTPEISTSFIDIFNLRPPIIKHPFVSSQLLYGRIFEDRRLEGIVIHHPSPNSLYVASGISTWKDSPDTWSNVICKFI
jgi:hypothetical protein